MKTLTLILAFIVFSSMNTKEENPILGRETLIDMIERAEYIPVYFVTKEVLYSHKVTDYSAGAQSGYSTCNKMTEVIPLPATFEPAYDKLVAELNRVFKTNKFVAKPASDIPLLETNGKESNGKFSSWAPKKISPSLKKYNFSDVTAPFFVFCSIGAIYKNNSLLLTSDLGKMQLKQLESEGQTLVEKTDIILQGFVNVRLLNYDSKKSKVNYADLEVFNVFTSVDDEVFESTDCISSIKDCTSQIDPSMVAEDLISEIDGMFDEFAASKMKKVEDPALELSAALVPQVVSPEVASLKPSEWIKGESLADRIKRNDDNGNFIGIIYRHNLKDSEYASESYFELGNVLTEKVKKTFNVENVEIIDLSKIPLNADYKDWEDELKKKYRWWDTKYKTVISFYTSVGLSTRKVTDNFEESTTSISYYATEFYFNSGATFYEFYQKKGKEKLSSYEPSLSLSIPPSRVDHPNESLPEHLSSQIRIAKDTEVMRIVKNNMELELSKFVAEKFEIKNKPELIKPNFSSDDGSKANNIPVKGETFSDKVNRLSAAGNAVGIIFNVNDLYIDNPNDKTTQKLKIGLPFPEKDQLNIIADSFVDKLNETYNTKDFFVLVDINNMPYGVSWQETKYKIIIKLEVRPKYWGGTDSKNSTEFNFRTSILVKLKEYFKEDEINKSTRILLDPFSLVKYGASSKVEGASVGSVNVEELDDNCNRSKGDEFVESIQKILNENYPKLIKKLNK